jgi:hypothetical protein
MNIVIFIGLKCSLYGFIHGYFINCNEIQYILLILIKIFLIGIIRKNCELFEHKLLSMLNMLYYFGGILIDLVCLLSKI